MSSEKAVMIKCFKKIEKKRSYDRFEDFKRNMNESPSFGWTYKFSSETEAREYQFILKDEIIRNGFPSDFQNLQLQWEVLQNLNTVFRRYNFNHYGGEILIQYIVCMKFYDTCSEILNQNIHQCQPIIKDQIVELFNLAKNAAPNLIKLYEANYYHYTRKRGNRYLFLRPEEIKEVAKSINITCTKHDKNFKFHNIMKNKYYK